MNWGWWLYYGSIMAGALLAGVLVVPASVYLFAPSWPRGVRNVMGKILFCVQQITFGAGVLVERAVGGYEHFAADVDEDGNAIITMDGERVKIDREKIGWTRLGFADFGLTYEKADETFEEVTPNDDPQPVMQFGEDQQFGLLERVRGGYQEFIHCGEEGEGGWQVRLDAMQEWIGRKAGGPHLANVAEEQALKKFGGDNGLSGTAQVAGIILCLILGMVTGYLGVAM